MYCSKCGKQIPDNSLYCPDCCAVPTINAFSAAGFVLSLISMFLTSFGAVAIAVIAGVLSVIGLNQCKKHQRQRGKGFSIAGIIIALYTFHALYG